MVEQQQVMGLMGWMVGRGGCRRAMTVVCCGCARHSCARRMYLGLIFSSWRAQAEARRREKCVDGRQVGGDGQCMWVFGLGLGWVVCR